VIQPTTYSLTASGQVVTVGGASPTTYYPQNLALFLNGKPYVYQATAAQTAAQVASGLASKAAVDFPSISVTGAQITAPAGVRIGALRVGSTGTTITELRRQERQFQISTWAPNPDLRDAIAAPVDVAIANSPFIGLADGTKGRLIYRSSALIDTDQKQGIFRRDLIVSVEYATTSLDTWAQMVAGITELEAPAGTLVSTTYS
jgi:hypothetical protein